jgi:hypothetical protein
MIGKVRYEIAVPLELDALFRCRPRQRGLHVRAQNPLRIGIEVVEVVTLATSTPSSSSPATHVRAGEASASPCRRVRPTDCERRETAREELVVDAHFGRHRVLHGKPVDVPFHLAGVAPGFRWVSGS